MSMSASLHGAKIARHVSISVSGGIDALEFEAGEGNYIVIFVPSHVAAATAAAFNAAMAEQPAEQSERTETEGTPA